MKQVFLKRMAIIAIAVFTLPAALLAQDDKQKEKIEKDKVKEKKTNNQQIIITRSGDKNEKTVIEIDGDKVKVNGKDVADLKDIQVHVNNWTMPNITALRTPGQGNYSFNFDDSNGGFWKVDSNRAMLGINTNSDDKGAEIESVVGGSAAEKAGLKKGDIITKIDNRKIDAADDVTDAIRAHKPGDKVTVTYLRDDKENKATAELGRWKGMDVYSATTVPKIMDAQMWKESLNDRVADRITGTPRISGGTLFSTSSRGPKLGMSVQDTDEGKGVKVLEVDDEGTAAKAGIKEGDVLTQIDDKTVNSADEVAKVVKEKKEQPSMKFQVTRNGKPQTIEVKYPKKIKTVDL